MQSSEVARMKHDEQNIRILLCDAPEPMHDAWLTHGRSLEKGAKEFLVSTGMRNLPGPETFRRNHEPSSRRYLRTRRLLD